MPEQTIAIGVRSVTWWFRARRTRSREERISFRILCPMLLGPWSIGWAECPTQKPDLANMGLGVVDGAQVKIGQAVHHDPGGVVLARDGKIPYLCVTQIVDTLIQGNEGFDKTEEEGLLEVSVEGYVAVAVANA